MTDEFEDEVDLLTGGMKYPPKRFRDDDLIRQYRPLFSRYIDMRVAGKSAKTSFLQCFGSDYYDQHLTKRIEALEGGESFQRELEKRKKDAKFEDIFDLKRAVYGWLEIIQDPEARDSSRVAAMKELQVLYGMTIIDENGNTRAGKTLADFYVEQVKPLTAGVGDLHAAPGSPEAEAFERNTS